MQPQNDPAIRRLREIENESVPDLTQLNRHWKDMQLSMTGTPTAPHLLYRYRWFFLSVTAGLAGLMAWLLSAQSGTHLPDVSTSPSASGDTVPIRMVASQAVKTSPAKADSLPLRKLVQSGRVKSSADTLVAIAATRRVADTSLPIVKPIRVIKRDTLLLRARNSDGRDTILTAIPVQHSDQIAAIAASQPVAVQQFIIQSAGLQLARIDSMPLKVRLIPISRMPDTIVLRLNSPQLPVKSQ